MEAEDLGRIWQHVELSTEGHNGVFLWLNRNACWGRSKLRCPRAALPHMVTELRLAATPIWRQGKGTVELGLTSPMLSLGGEPWGQHMPLNRQTPSTLRPAPAAFAPTTPGLTDAGLQSMERSTGQQFGSVYL